MRLLWRLEATTSPAPATTRAWEARRPPVLLYHYSATRPLGSPPPYGGYLLCSEPLGGQGFLLSLRPAAAWRLTP
jgi:hypothetical protein